MSFAQKAGEITETNQTIMIDRSLVYLLASEKYLSAPTFSNIVSAYSVVAYELAGASALERAIRENHFVTASKLSLSGKDLPVLDDEEKARIRTMVEDSLADPKAIALVADYAWNVGAVKYDPSEALSYLIRLLLLTHSLRADLICSEDRWNLLGGFARLQGEIEPSRSADSKTLSLTPATLLKLNQTANAPHTAIFSCRTDENTRRGVSIRGPSSSCRKNDSKLFISYRRKDEAGFAHAIYHWLERAFPANSIFMDVEGDIKPGENFVTALDLKINQCDVFLVIIGQRWVPELITRSDDHETDFVVQEIRLAMELGKHVIPVLVGHTQMPSAGILPESIRELANRNAIFIRTERFRADCESLIEYLEKMA